MFFKPVFTNVPPAPALSEDEQRAFDRLRLSHMIYKDGPDTDRDFGLKALVDDKTLEEIQESDDVCPHCGQPLTE